MRYTAAELGRGLIIGGGGQLGTDLGELLAEPIVLTRAELDVTDHGAVGEAIASMRPSVVFNCAAFHDVDLCESEEHNAFEVNARAVKRLAECCAESGAKLVHVSTNYVFDGTRTLPYTELDQPSPRSAYAISKLAGEHAALAYAPGALVVRTAGLYGLSGRNFVVRILARAREQGQLRVVDDQRLTPTFTADLAAALVDAVGADVQGRLHLTNSGACSWYEFTLQILERAGLSVPVDAVPTTPTPGLPDRPLNGVLESVVASAAGLRPLRRWDEALADYMERAALHA